MGFKMDLFYLEKGKEHLARFVAGQVEGKEADRVSRSKIDEVRVAESSGDTARLRLCGYELHLYNDNNPDGRISNALGSLASDGASLLEKGLLTSRLGYVLFKKLEVIEDASVESAKRTIASIISGFNFKLKRQDPLYPCNIVILPGDVSVEERSEHLVELRHAGWRGHVCSDLELTVRMRDYLEKEGMRIHAFGTEADFSYVLGLPK